MKTYMALSCKLGTFNKVLDELIKLNLSKKNIFLLFGSVDVLIQFPELNNLGEFIIKWFNPIINIMPEEPLIEKTQTFIVISEGNTFAEDPYAFLFLNTQPRNLKQVQQELQSIPNVLSADTVFGPYDVICAVKANDKEDLTHLLYQIQKEVSQIQGTNTKIVSSLY